MRNPSFYSFESVNRLRKGQIATAILAGIACTYMIATTAMSMRQVWSAQSLLRKGKGESATLSRQAATEKRQEERRPPPSDGGVDAFAVRLSSWATARRVRIESFVPEGSPTATQVTVDGSDLGTWDATRVRVRGRGGYVELLDLLDKLRNPQFPVKMESFALQGCRDGARGQVDFDLVLTVYEKKGQAG